MEPIAHVKLPALADGRDALLWPALLDLADLLPQPWVVIGGQMVHLHGVVAGRVQPRVTQDIDVLFDIRAEVRVIAQAVMVLTALGYRVDGMSPDGLAHRYRSDDGVLVDVLAPDHMGARAAPRMVTTPPGRTVEVPGGRAALDHRIAVTITYLSRRSTVYVPDLAHAIHSKVKAFQRDGGGSPAGRSRHLDDLAFLCSLVDEPDECRALLGKARRTFRASSLAVLDDPMHPAWRLLGSEAQDAQLVWEQLRSS